MIGKLLSKALKIVTVPLDIGDAALDLATGGNGKKASRERLKSDVPCVSSLRDAACDVLESLDD